MTISRTIASFRRHWQLTALLALLFAALPAVAQPPALPAELPVLGGGGVTVVPGPSDFMLRIPSIDLEVSVREAVIRGDTWDFSVFTHEAAHLQLTGLPGQGTNVVIGAHYELARRAPGPFIHLDRIAVGEEVLLEYQGSVYVYEVSATRLVSPEDIEVAYRTPDEVLTLLTCYDYRPGSGEYAGRFVVRAALVEVREAVVEPVGQ